LLDAGYLSERSGDPASAGMLDILKFAQSEIQKHPVSRNQYPGSRDITNDFHHNDLNPGKHFMQLKEF
jgi:hypothetical protein